MNTNLRPLSPFQDFCVKFLGYVPSSYDECMTYLECLIYTYNYLKNEIVPTVATQNVVIQEMEDYINHYFDNLDVQEEINNKLDDMVAQGTLQQIIIEYLQTKATYSFDTVQDMKNSSDLIDGSYAQTLGFYAKGDDGGAIYKIRELSISDTVNEMNIIAIGNDLVAELININKLNVKQFGAKGDGTTDDTLAISTAINFIETNDILELLFPYGFYKISNTLQISKPIKLKGCLSTVYNTNTDVKSVSLYWTGNANNNIIEIDSNAALVNGLNIENIGFNGGNVDVIGLDLTKTKYSRIINCSFTNIKGCIYLSGNSYHNIIEKCFFRSYTEYGIKIDKTNTPSNSNIINENVFTLTNDNYGIYINSANAIMITNNMIEGNGSNLHPIYIYGNNNASGITITGNRIETITNLDNNQTPNFLIEIIQEAKKYTPNNIYINNNALYPQIIKNNTTIVNNYYLIKNESVGLNYNEDEQFNLVKNSSLILNGSNIPYYWKTNSAHVSFSKTVKTSITISSETAKYPSIYQFIDIKKYRGKKLCLSYKIKCANATTEPTVDCDIYKGGTQQINNRGTYEDSAYLKEKVYDDNYLIGTGYLYIPDDADDLFVNINFNGNGSTTPADNVMEVDYINISNIFVSESNYLDHETNIIDVKPSNNRPTGYDGMTIFDSTLLKTITYYNGNWYDGSGTSV